MSSVSVSRPADRRQFWAVWNWSWKLKLLCAFALVAGYIVGAVPIIYTFDKLGIVNDAYVEFFIVVFYAPLIWLDTNVEGFRWFFTTEKEIIDWLVEL